jgi:hypothetical protein
MPRPTAPDNPRENWTHHHSIRIEDADWAAFDDATKEYGGRSTVVRRLIKLFLADSWIGARIRAAVAKLDDPIHTGGDYRSPEAKAARTP